MSIELIVGLEILAEQFRELEKENKQLKEDAIADEEHRLVIEKQNKQLKDKLDNIRKYIFTNDEWYTSNKIIDPTLKSKQRELKEILGDEIE